MLGKHRAAKTGAWAVMKPWMTNGCKRLLVYPKAFFSTGGGGGGGSDALLTAKKAMNPLHLMTYFLGTDIPKSTV